MNIKTTAAPINTHLNAILVKIKNESGMKVINKANFMAENPTEVSRMYNRFGQEVIFYEHPIYGDEASLTGVISETAFDTGFMDTSDFYEGSDYNPILYAGMPLCEFEFDTHILDKGIFSKHFLGDEIQLSE